METENGMETVKGQAISPGHNNAVMNITIQTMGKEALESYARTHFGQELDRRRSVESLRQQVTLLIDQFGAP